MTNVVTLLLADHHVLVAEGLRMLLAAEDDLDVLGLAHHSGQAIELAAKHQPTVLVLDAELPVGDLDETLAAVRATASATRLLVLGGAAHPATTAAVLAAGADGWLAKSAPVARWRPPSATSPPVDRCRWWRPRHQRAVTPASSCGCGP